MKIIDDMYISEQNIDAQGDLYEYLLMQLTTAGKNGQFRTPRRCARSRASTYAPSDTVYWQHDHSTERDFIYVTTQNLSHDQLQELSDEVGRDRTLLVLCTAFRGKADRYPNLTVKKIPKQVLSRCEWGHDDYSLQVENLPKVPPELGQIDIVLE